MSTVWIVLGLIDAVAILLGGLYGFVIAALERRRTIVRHVLQAQGTSDSEWFDVPLEPDMRQLCDGTQHTRNDLKRYYEAICPNLRFRYIVLERPIR